MTAKFSLCVWRLSFLNQSNLSLKSILLHPTTLVLDHRTLPRSWRRGECCDWCALGYGRRYHHCSDRLDHGLDKAVSRSISHLCAAFSPSTSIARFPPWPGLPNLEHCSINASPILCLTPALLAQTPPSRSLSKLTGPLPAWHLF